MLKSAVLLIVCTVTLALSQPAEAGVVFNPHPGFPSPPNYFSGTNCRANYEAHCTFPTYHISNAKLKIGGTLVWDNTETPEDPFMGPFRYGVGPNFMFDSTHFPPTSFVEIELILTTNTGIYSDAYVGYTYNYGQSVEDNESGGGSIMFAGFLNTNNYNYSILGPEDQWTPLDCVNAMRWCNIGMVTSHGSPGMHQDWHNEDPVMAFNGSELDTYKVSKDNVMLSGLPPYNAGAVPPLNFLYLYCCSTCNNNDFEDALTPKYNAYGGFLENQAVLGYKDLINGGQDDEHCEVLMNSLMSGKCLLAAACDMVDEENDLKVFVANSVGRQMVLSDLNIIGDPAMRIKSVYTGTCVLPSSDIYALDYWVRQL